MDGGNSNQNNQNKQNSQNNSSNSNNQPKAGLSWSQPTPANVQNKNTSTGGNTSNTKPVSTAAAQAADSTGRVIGIIVGIIVVFALAAWGIVALHKRSVSSDVSTASSTSETTTDNTSPETAPTDANATPTTEATAPTPAHEAVPVKTAAAGSATLDVASSQAAGDQVAFTNLSVSVPTWIVVYEETNGEPGRILGAQLYFKGDTAGTVQLLRPTVSGQNYYVAAALDNGNKTFAKADEKFVLDSSGKQMWIKFQAR